MRNVWSPALDTARGASIRARRALAATLCVVLAFPALAGSGLGCSRGATPIVPPEEPPLPPASGTPIGYLLDASELELGADQRTQLQAIDLELARRLEAMDTSLRQPDPAAPVSPRQETGGRGLGFRAGGAQYDRNTNMSGMGGRMTTLPEDGAGSSPPPRRGDDPALAGRAMADRDARVREALSRAFALLDVVQRVIARRVLSRRGIELPTGATRSAPARPSGSP